MNSNKDINTEDLIFRFVNNQMDSDERLSFLEMCKKDEALKKEVVFQKKLKFAYQHQDDFLVFSTIQDRQEQYTFNSFSSKKYLVIAGGLVLAVLFYFLAHSFMENQSRVEKTQALLINYSKPYPMYIGGLDLSATTPFSKAVNAYLKPDYPNAAIFFGEEYRRSKNQNLDAKLFEGISLYLAGNEELALQSLVVVAESKQNINQVAEWYLALSLLKKGDLTEAKMHLAKLKTSNEFAEQAQKLLEDLDKNEI